MAIKLIEGKEVFVKTPEMAGISILLQNGVCTVRWCNLSFDNIDPEYAEHFARTFARVFYPIVDLGRERGRKDFAYDLRQLIDEK